MWFRGTDDGNGPDMSDTQKISHYLCIGCPLGCRLEVEEDDYSKVVEVRGWSCKKGETYGREEHTDPRRMVSTTVRVEGAGLARLPVKSGNSLPKGSVTRFCAELRKVRAQAPVRMGEVVASNVAGTGVDAVATRDLS